MATRRRSRHLDLSATRARHDTWAALARDGLPDCDAVVNLAGRHILDTRRRWSAAYRDEVISSRVETTRTLVAAINASLRPLEVFVSTAGKCFYGTGEVGAAQSYPELDEESEPVGIDFPAEVVALWEKAAEGTDTTRVRHIRLRIGVVLDAVHREGFLGRLWRIERRAACYRSSGCRSASALAA